MGKLIKSEKHQILLIQETKTQGHEALREIQQLWKAREGVVISVRGALGEICTIWNTTTFHEERRYEATHWVMAQLKHLPSSKIYLIINVYIPNNYWEKVECWESLLGIKDVGFLQNCIMACDFNTTIHMNGKEVAL